VRVIEVIELPRRQQAFAVAARASQSSPALYVLALTLDWGRPVPQDRRATAPARER
jgi:hypothetical protein